ncbi:MAG TPA: aminopeptidase [Steroidobacteraceae bacterium]|nr:aminopeptidase [Steroidobacteraceae bacterium]
MPIALRCVVLLALGFVSSGCYVTQAARGQFEVMRRSQPIDRVLADPATGEATRKGLELTMAAREFAEAELGLPASRSYRKYADLGRPYVVWNVVATPEFSVEPRRSCFPVAGCVSYRGYFKEAAARNKALQLATRGDDVSVGGVPTYSTLGHLPDPVFNAMLGWRETRLVGTIFHELAHELLYVAGDSEFNEAFASVVEEEGVRRWLARTAGRTNELQQFELANRREAEFARLLRRTRDRLERLYASGLDVETLRVEKQREFGRLKFEYERLRASWGDDHAYDGWFRRSLNNAHLASVATYRDCMPGLRRLLEQTGQLADFYDRARALARQSQAERHAAVCEVVTPESDGH